MVDEKSGKKRGAGRRANARGEDARDGSASDASRLRASMRVSGYHGMHWPSH